jgi:hypothetical protein
LQKNVYDRLDLPANTAGIALAIGLDVIVKPQASGMMYGHNNPRGPV